MTYLEIVHQSLQPHSHSNAPRVLDLFAGCGGLALGFEAQGFETLGFESNEDCCLTYRHNLNGDCVQTRLDQDFQFPSAEVVIGGPPCQPFSVGGNQRGLNDARDGFPAFISAIKQVKPEIWMFENVRGLMYRNKSYLDLILSELSSLGYVVDYQLLNAVDYGVPQNRERMIVVGHRGHFRFPVQSGRRYCAGDAVGDLVHLVDEQSRFLTASMDAYVAKYERASKCITPRNLHMDRPSRTVTCRNLAGATGDMLRVLLPDGRRRRLTVREGARLQSFPDWFEFQGKVESQFNQIGNAVPPMLAYAIASEFRAYLESGWRLSPEEIRRKKIPAQLSFLE